MKAEKAIERILAEISKQASTGTPVTPLPEEWVRALPRLEGVACEWTMEDTLMSSYLWFEDGDYYAANLPSGLENREDTPLNVHAAAALLEGGISHKPVDLEEVR